MSRPTAFLLLTLTSTVYAASDIGAWPTNTKKGCVLKNKRDNYAELTKTCSDADKLTYCSSGGDPASCAACETYDAAAKVSFCFFPTYFLFRWSLFPWINLFLCSAPLPPPPRLCSSPFPHWHNATNLIKKPVALRGTMLQSKIRILVCCPTRVCVNFQI